MSDAIGLLRHLLAASWSQLLRVPADPDERDEDALAHLAASRWLDDARDADDAVARVAQKRERLWLSPACLDATRQPSLFGAAGAR